MGSVVSFVILCILNAAIIRFSYELSENRVVSLEKCPMSVNGDDGLVRASALFSVYWSKIAAVAGLKPSVGKVYTHPTYANINSTSYLFQDSHFELIPYVNMGLVFGMQRAKVGHTIRDVVDWDERAGSFGARHRDLIRLCPPQLRLAAHRLFLERHKDLLSGILAGAEWYVPEEFGGLGFASVFEPATYPDLSSLDPYAPLPDLVGELSELPPPRYGMQPWQIEAVAFMENHPHRYHVRRLPTSAPVRARAAWERSIPFQNSRRCTYELSDDDICLLDVSSYYTVPSLVCSELESDPLRVFRANLRFWAQLRRRFDRNRTLDPVSATPSVFDNI
jgi:hypothetical protein